MSHHDNGKQTIDLFQCAGAGGPDAGLRRI